MTEQPQDYEIIWEKPKACKRPGQARVRRETPLSIEGQVEGSGEPQSNYPQQRLRFRFVDQLHDPLAPSPLQFVVSVCYLANVLGAAS